MAHNALIRSGGWTAGTTVLASELASFDSAIASTINGDDGGCWAPSVAITIGGQGLHLTGPLAVARGGQLTTGTGGSGITINVTGGVPAWPQLAAGHSGRTVQRLVACAESRAYPRHLWRCRRTDGAMQSITPAYIDSSNTVKNTRLWVPIRAYQGSTLSKVTIHFRVSTAHAAIPSVMPKARVLRQDSTGNTVVLTSTAAGGDASGYVAVPTPASPAAWSPNVAPQSFTITCDQNNVVDRTLYAYIVEIVEETTPGYPFTLAVKSSVKGFAAGVYPNALSGGDGVTYSDGDRVMLSGCPDASQNGIWTAHAGNWTRAPDWKLPSDFSQGMLVPIQQGNLYGGTLWQASSNTAAWSPGQTPPGTKVWLASTQYVTSSANAASMYVVPSSGASTGYFYVCQAIAGTGTSGTTEPNWPTAIGQQVIDNPGANQITWQCAGAIATPITFVTRPDGDGGAEGAAIVAHGNIWQSMLVEYDNVVDGRFA